MENRVLKYFLIVAREENITRAAEIIHISQPALSRQLMQLEEELGVKLFIRGKRNVALTEEGRFLRRRAQEIVDLTEKTERDFRRNSGRLGGDICIGMGESRASALMAEYVSAFSEDHPDVRFEYFTGNGDNIKERLEKGLIDVGVLLEPTDLSKYEYVRLPIADRWGVLTKSDSPLAEKNEIAPSDLIGRKLIVPKRNREVFVTKLGIKDDDIFLTHNLLYNAALLVKSGECVAITVDGAATLYENPELVFRPFAPEWEISSVFVWKKYQTAAPAVLKFIEYVKMQAKHNYL